MIRFLCLCKTGALLFLENKLKSILIAISKYNEQYNLHNNVIYTYMLAV